MRVLILATALLASSSLYPAFAQEGNKDQDTAPQTAPAQTNQNAPVQPDQSKADNREVGRDWRMHRDREVDRDRDMDRGGYRERGDRADRDRGYRGYHDEDRPRRRVRICVEYENGDEYCRYRN